MTRESRSDPDQKFLSRVRRPDRVSMASECWSQVDRVFRNRVRDCIFCFEIGSKYVVLKKPKGLESGNESKRF